MQSFILYDWTQFAIPKMVTLDYFQDSCRAVLICIRLDCCHHYYVQTQRMNFLNHNLYRFLFSFLFFRETSVHQGKLGRNCFFYSLGLPRNTCLDVFWIQMTLQEEVKSCYLKAEVHSVRHSEKSSKPWRRWSTCWRLFMLKNRFLDGSSGSCTMHYFGVSASATQILYTFFSHRMFSL